MLEVPDLMIMDAGQLYPKQDCAGEEIQSPSKSEAKKLSSCAGNQSEVLRGYRLTTVVESARTFFPNLGAASGRGAADNGALVGRVFKTLEGAGKAKAVLSLKYCRCEGKPTDAKPKHCASRFLSDIADRAGERGAGLPVRRIKAYKQTSLGSIEARTSFNQGNGS